MIKISQQLSFIHQTRGMNSLAPMALILLFTYNYTIFQNDLTLHKFLLYTPRYRRQRIVSLVDGNHSTKLTPSSLIVERLCTFEHGPCLDHHTAFSDPVETTYPSWCSPAPITDSSPWGDLAVLYCFHFDSSCPSTAEFWHTYSPLRPRYPGCCE